MVETQTWRPYDTVSFKNVKSQKAGMIKQNVVFPACSSSQSASVSRMGQALQPPWTRCVMRRKESIGWVSSWDKRNFHFNDICIWNRHFQITFLNQPTWGTPILGALSEEGLWSPAPIIHQLKLQRHSYTMWDIPSNPASQDISEDSYSCSCLFFNKQTKPQNKQKAEVICTPNKAWHLIKSFRWV